MPLTEETDFFCFVTLCNITVNCSNVLSLQQKPSTEKTKILFFWFERTVHNLILKTLVPGIILSP